MSEPAPKKRGRPRVHSDATRAAVVDAVLVRHFTVAQASRDHGVDERTVKRWAKAAEASAPLPEAPPPDALPLAQAPALKPTGDSIADSRAIQERLFAAAAEAEQLGHSAEARKNYQEAVKLSAVISRLERERDREHGTTITPEDIAAAKKSLQDQIDALRRRPLMCAKCHRELSLEVAQNGSEE